MSTATAKEPRLDHSSRTARIEVQPGTEVMVYDGGGGGDPGVVREVGYNECLVEITHTGEERGVPWEQIQVQADQFVGLPLTKQKGGSVAGYVGGGASIVIRPGVKVRAWVDGVTEDGTILAIQPLGCVLSNRDGLIRPTFARWKDMDLMLDQFVNEAGELTPLQQARPDTEAQPVAAAESEAEPESAAEPEHVADEEPTNAQGTIPAATYDNLDECERLAVGVLTILDHTVNQCRAEEVTTHIAPAAEIIREVVKRFRGFLDAVHVDYGAPVICDECLEKAPPTEAGVAAVGG